MHKLRSLASLDLLHVGVEVTTEVNGLSLAAVKFFQDLLLSSFERPASRDSAMGAKEDYTNPGVNQEIT